MSKLFYNLKSDSFICLVCAILWCILNEQMNISTFLLGIILGILALNAGRLLLGFSFNLHPRDVHVPNLICYVSLLVFQIYKSSLQCLPIIIKGNAKVKVLNIPLKSKDEWKKIMIANSVTLTPGSVTIEVFKDSVLVLVYSTNNGEDIRDFDHRLTKEEKG